MSADWLRWRSAEEEGCCCPSSYLSRINLLRRRARPGLAAAAFVLLVPLLPVLDGAQQRLLQLRQRRVLHAPGPCRVRGHHSLYTLTAPLIAHSRCMCARPRDGQRSARPRDAHAEACEPASVEGNDLSAEGPVWGLMWGLRGAWGPPVPTKRSSRSTGIWMLGRLDKRSPGNVLISFTRRT